MGSVSTRSMHWAVTGASTPAEARSPVRRLQHPELPDAQPESHKVRVQPSLLSAGDVGSRSDPTIYLGGIRQQLAVAQPTLDVGRRLRSSIRAPFADELVP